MMGHQIPLSKVAGRCARSRAMEPFTHRPANRDLAVTRDCHHLKQTQVPNAQIGKSSTSGNFAGNATNRALENYQQNRAMISGRRWRKSVCKRPLEREQ